MDKEWRWKSLILNQEFHIAGGFIYDGLRIFDQMRVFDEEHSFGFLYNISIGIERLEKILICISDKNFFEIEKKIKTHNHLALLSLIEKEHNLKFEGIHKKFIELLSNFYFNIRYDKFNFEESNVFKAKDTVMKYIRDVLNIEIHDLGFLNTEFNNDYIKKRIGKMIGKITNDLYEKISMGQHTVDGYYIHPTETHSQTKACKIFLGKSYDFLREKKLMKEIVIFLLNNKKESKLINFIRDIEPLEFDPVEVEEYIKRPNYDLEQEKRQLIDIMDLLYEEMSEKDRKERLEQLSIIEHLESSSDDIE